MLLSILKSILVLSVFTISGILAASSCDDCNPDVLQTANPNIITQDSINTIGNYSKECTDEINADSVQDNSTSTTCDDVICILSCVAQKTFPVRITSIIFSKKANF